MKLLKLLINTIMLAFIILAALPLNSEAKTINYSGLTMLHSGSSSAGDDLLLEYGIGCNQNHSISIESKPTSIKINSFNTTINKTKRTQRAEAKANQSLQEINHNKYGLKKLNEKFNNIKLDIPPKITKVSGKNNATATINSTMEIIIDAEDATKYRARANAIPNNINWETSNTLSVGGLKQGANTIHVQATNESGKVTNHKITIFRIK